MNRRHYPDLADRALAMTDDMALAMAAYCLNSLEDHTISARARELAERVGELRDEPDGLPAKEGA